ncbi:MAG: hypothetical protein E4G94_06345 [ANME-2 cluster archaeon]|nr:MAG: hypothetical protein E4G94_06345 [ANME-2 cluster archaeon]
MKQTMKWFVLLTAVILILSSTVMMVNAGKGGPGGKPGSGGGAPTSDAGDLYGDLIVLNREEVNGVPIYNPDNGMCEQFINSTGAIVDMTFDADSQSCTIPEGADTIEVGFGRLNVVRSPSQVLESKFDEAILGLNAAEKISLDVSGRLLLTKRAVGSDGVEYTYEKAIDSPGENLALYKKLLSQGHLEGNLGDDPNAHVGDPLADPVLRPVLNVSHFNQVVDINVTTAWGALLNGSTDQTDLPLTEEDLLFAASFLAAGGDKTGHITLDMVFYMNSIMGLNTKNESGFYDQTTVVDFSMFDIDRSPRYQKSVYVLVPELNATGAWVNLHWVEAWVELMNDSKWTDTYMGSNPEVFIWDTAEGWEYDSDDIGGFAQVSDDNQRVLAYTHAHFVPPAPTDIPWVEGSTQAMNQYQKRYQLR